MSLSYIDQQTARIRTHNVLKAATVWGEWRICQHHWELERLGWEEVFTPVNETRYPSKEAAEAEIAAWDAI